MNGEHDQLQLTAQERAQLYAAFWNTAINGEFGYTDMTEMRNRVVEGYIADTAAEIAQRAERGLL